MGDMKVFDERIWNYVPVHYSDSEVVAIGGTVV